jgi:hypothetical protein
MDVVFPVFVRARDSGEIFRFMSIYEMQRELERVDIENSEYDAWDSNGRPLGLSVDQPRWLDVTIDASGRAQGSLRDALLSFASRARVDVDPTVPLDQLFEMITGTPEPRGVRRLLRRLLPHRNRRQG